MDNQQESPARRARGALVALLAVAALAVAVLTGSTLAGDSSVATAAPQPGAAQSVEVTPVQDEQQAPDTQQRPGGGDREDCPKDGQGGSGSGSGAAQTAPQASTSETPSSSL